MAHSFLSEHGNKVVSASKSPFVLIREEEARVEILKRSASLEVLVAAMRRAGGPVSYIGGKQVVENGVLRHEGGVVVYRGIYELSSGKKVG